MSSLSSSASVPFFSLWTFQPKSSTQKWTDDATRAYGLMMAIKNHQHYAGELAIDRSIEYMCEAVDDWTALFENDCVAVPVPSSAPKKKDALWVPLEIAKSLRKNRLVADVSTCLTRTERVTRSATAGRGNRPNPRAHYDTIAFDSLVDFGTSKVVLVDDIITRGATIWACAAKLRDSVSGCHVAGFTLERTMGLNNFVNAKDPAVGTISGSEYSSSRDP